MANRSHPESCFNGNLTEIAFQVLKAVLDSSNDDVSTLDGIADAIVFIMGKSSAEELAYFINERIENSL